MIEVIFDVETKKFFDEVEGRDAAKLGVTVVSVYRRSVNSKGIEIDGEIKSFWDREAGLEPEVDKMWNWFEGADRIIGFNSLGFDVPVLVPYYNNGDLFTLPHFDILEKIRLAFGRRISLDAVAKETLKRDEAKIATGEMAVTWWNQRTKESLSKLQKYCEVDVMVTKDVYDKGMKEGKLKFKDRWNELREISVDFSYPKIEATEVQMELF